MDWRPEEAIGIEDVRGFIAGGATLSRNSASRFSFVRKGEGAVLLFVDGECFECDGETVAFAEQLCGQDRVDADPDLAKTDSAIALIATILNQGSVTFEAGGLGFVD